MLKIRGFYGSIYARFLSAFLGAFLIAILIPAIGINFIQVSRVENNIAEKISDKANNLKELISIHGLSVDDAIRIVKTDEIDIDKLDSLQSAGIVLTDAQIAAAERGQIISQFHATEGRWLIVFKTGDIWVYIHPNNQNGMFVFLRSMQIYLVVVPVVLGTVLIFLTAITVAKPIKKLSVASKRVAGGDLKVHIPAKGHGELRELTDNFNHMVKKLSENEYLHKEFVSNVSHEFNTPITSLMGYAKLLKRKTLTDEKRNEYANIILYESERLSKLCKDLLRLSELENQGRIEILETFSLDEQIREAVVLLQHSWEDKNIDIDLDMDEIFFSGDKALMYHVWINILSNAVKYTDKDGKIRISLKYDGGDIVATISDNGTGMSEEELEKVFVRFYKADRARNSSGSGLGLSITKKIVELHKGSIQVDSRKEMDTTFTVRLPGK